MKNFNYFNPSENIEIYKELCSIIFQLGEYGTALNFMNSKGFSYTIQEFVFLKSLLENQLGGDLKMESKYDNQSN